MIGGLEIDLAAVRANVRGLRRLVAPAGICVVVKSDAYGHGLVPTARAIESDVARLAVYRLEEALTLREAGVRGPVHVLGPIPSARLREAVDAGVETTLWDAGTWRAELVAAALAAGRRAAVHLKIETGTTRFGLAPRDAPTAIGAALAEAALDVRGVFTHLAAAEEDVGTAYTIEQRDRFLAATASTAAALAERGAVRHAAASAAAIVYPSLRLGMVRTGIAAYGLWPSPWTRETARGRLVLTPALRYTSTLVVVREVPAGTSVGYDRTYVTERPARIGIIPIGYAEGIPRAASGRAEMLVHGRRVPVRGRICMNVTFVDVTEVPEARPGSAVTVIGADGDAVIGADAWAAWSDTISYEITTRLPSELPRRYFDREAELRSADAPADNPISMHDAGRSRGR